jgi:hypothetical protein
MKVNKCFIEAANAAFWLPFSDGAMVAGSLMSTSFSWFAGGRPRSIA